jgi:TRAP-type C4-dicarboxylate transport system substrate-binding protein
VRHSNMKTLAAVACVLVLPLIAPAAGAQTTLTFGGSDAIGTTIDRGNAMFAKLVNDRAAGKLKINFIQGEQLGNDVQVIEQMMKGSVHLYGDVLDWYANWVKDFSIFAWGFTFRDNDHYQKFLDSETFARMSEELRTKQGVRILAGVPTQPRVLFAKRPINSPADLMDIKMRVPEIKTYLNLWTTLGTKPSRVAWAEVFLGLKTGVIDATEGPISSAYAAKFHNAASPRSCRRS